MNTKTTFKSLVAIALLGISLNSSAQFESYGSNLVVNGGFEDATTAPWVKNVNTARETAAERVIFGAVCIRFTGVTAFSNIYQFVKVEHGARYEFGFTARIQDAVGPAGSPSTNRSIGMYLKDKVGTEGVTLASTAAITTSTNTTEKFEYLNEANYDSIMVTVSKNNGIGYADSIYVRKMIFTSVVNNSAINLKLYPKSQNTFTIVSDKPLKGVEIFSMSGVCIARKEVSGLQTTLSMTGEKAGVYIVRATLENGFTGVMKYMLR